MKLFFIVIFINSLLYSSNLSINPKTKIKLGFDRSREYTQDKEKKKTNLIFEIEKKGKVYALDLTCKFKAQHSFYADKKAPKYNSGGIDLIMEF